MGTPLDFGYKGYQNYGTYLKDKYQGQRVFKVIVDGGFTCPNRDGSKGFGGCTYCNVDSFTPDLSRKLPSLKEQVIQGMERARNSYKADKFIIYFQPNTNTYAPTHFLKMMYDEALSIQTHDIVGLSVGTRPDCLDPEKIALLESYSSDFDVDVEMGMESIYNDTLSQINRGCTHEEFLTTIDLLGQTSLEICVHTIFGFPWESKLQQIAYIDEINRLKQIKFIKFHHLHIVEGSIMGAKYKKDPFPLYTLETYTDLLCEILPRLRPDVIVQRLFGISDWDLLIAPNWNKKKSQIQTFIDKEIELRGVVQGSKFK